MADMWRPKGSQFFDANGNPLAGGRFRYFDAGTSDPRAVFMDEDALLAWTQPIELDSAGRLTASIYVSAGDFKETLSTSADVQIYSEDDIPGAIVIPDADFARPETPVIAKAGNYSVTTDDLGSLFELNATGGDFTLTLPDAVTAGNGATFYVVQVGTGGKVTLAPTGGQTVNGAASFALYGAYRGGKITSDGTSWSAIISDGAYPVVTTKTTTYNVVLADYGKLIPCNATGGAFSVNLPSAASAGNGFRVKIKKIDSSTNAVTIDGNSSETIEGATTFALGTQTEGATLRCDGSNWHIDSRSSGNASTTVRGPITIATQANAGLGTGGSSAVVPSGLFPPEVDVASATTTDIGAALSDKVRITGTTTITSFGTANAGIRREGRFAGALTLTHNGTSLLLPGVANITTAANDRFKAYSLGSGNWIVTEYVRANGYGVLSSFIGVQAFTGSGTYTPTAGAKSALVIVTGGGGGGGGSGSSLAGSGGGAGATAFLFVSSPASTSVTVGAAGASASAGGQSAFGTTTADGGAGGGAGGAAAGLGSATTANATFSVAGGDGGSASQLEDEAGDGGASFWGGGGRAQVSATGNGTSARAYGAGGGGSTGAGGNSGGSGAAGFVAVFEFA